MQLVVDLRCEEWLESGPIAMNFAANLWLFAASAGTLLALFLMILIVGYRRRRTFERVLFFFALAQFLYYSGILLIVNASLYYADRAPHSAVLIGYTFVSIGMVMIPGLLVHSHFAYGWARGGTRWRWWQLGVVVLAYLPIARYAAYAGENFIYVFDFAFPLSGDPMSPHLYYLWVASGLVICVALELAFARKSRKGAQRIFHNSLAIYFAGYGLLAVNSIGLAGTSIDRAIPWSPDNSIYWTTICLTFGWVLALASLVYAIVRYRALGIGSQKNLVYSVSIAFLAVLYLSVVRRISGWLEPYFPPEATAGVLLFLLLAFFEPLQRLASRLLRRGFQEQVDRLQRLSAELQREALRGEPGRLIEFAEEHIRREFGLELVRIRLNSAGMNGGGAANAGTTGEQRRGDVAVARPAWAGQPVRLRVGKPGAEMGELEVVPVGSAISGETSAALDFLAEQLPAVIELCRAIEQKVALERELDERERMALVGQMAASISHNLKNPLGSMKTILQVQLENAELPADARRDLAMVLAELDRLSVKLNQLLQYARPAVRASSAAPNRVVVGAIAEQVISLLRHDAERRGVSLSLSDMGGGALVSGPEEALTDILSNLIVNAIEAMAGGGNISVVVARESAQVVLTIADNGPGISPANLATVFQPFFTTKPSGTGLGLAIVERRAAEFGGTVACESPILNGRGARLVVRLPIADPAGMKGE